jgi:hypothetical protein
MPPVINAAMIASIFRIFLTHPQFAVNAASAACEATLTTAIPPVIKAPITANIFRMCHYGNMDFIRLVITLLNIVERCSTN